MNRIFGMILVAVLATAASQGQFIRDYNAPAILPLPPVGTGGSPYSADNVTTLVANCTDSMRVGSITCYVQLNHGRASDLWLELSHCGTSVTISPGNLANPNASLNGTYSFRDSAPTGFISAMNAAMGVVPPGSYQPMNQLSAFTGQSAAGPWTLQIIDQFAGDAGTAGNITIEITLGTPFGGPLSPSAAIPDGGNGNPGTPVTRVVNVPYTGKVGIVYASVGLSHSFTSDLTVVLSHAGVSATMMSFQNPFSGANLSGTYTFQDGAAAAWTQAVAGLSTTQTVQNGFYRPLTPFSAFSGLDQIGPWFLTVYDSGSGDTGFLTGVTLTIAESLWDLQIAQPFGQASAYVVNSGGAPGNHYANLYTFAPGAYPFGWLHGIDIAMADIVWEVSSGAPFYGSLDSCGHAGTIVQGPIPSNITAYFTSLELDSSGSIVNFKPAFAYTTP